MRHVLVVDDDPLMLDVLSYQLTAVGWRVTTARDGVEALQCIRECRPCAVVVDAVMPVMDGLQTLRWLRTTASTADLPVLVITARRDQAKVEEAIRLGADAFIFKPFGPAALHDRLEHLLEPERLASRKRPALKTG